jgi:plastocyanin
VLPSSSASGQAAEQGSSQGDVVTLSLKFMPETITVPAGTTVRWVNGETILHTITTGAWGDVNAATGLRGSQMPDGTINHRLTPEGDEGSTLEFTFDTPGTFPYYCEIHKAMNGVVIVE